MKYDIKTIDKWEAPKEDGVAILTMPNIPLPCHGLCPRTIDPTRWEKMRKQCYVDANYTCQATGEELGKGHLHCLPRDTEVLTSEGWKRIDSITLTDKVAQFKPEAEIIQFVNPTKTISYYEDNLIEIGYKRGLKIRSTANHRTLVFKWGKRKINTGKVYETIPAKDAPVGKLWNIWTAGYGVGETKLSDAERIYIALQADGTIGYQRKDNGNYVFRLRVSKERKKEQVKHLIHQCPFRCWKCPEKTRPNYLCYHIEVPVNCKNFWESFDLDSMSVVKAQEFIDELVKWDGWEGYRGKCYGRCYYTTSTLNKDFVQAVATLAGIDTHVTCSERKERHWDDGRILKQMDYKKCYNIEFHKRNYRGMQTMSKQTISYNDDVFCITVPSHYFVARQDGEVFITGNCHELYDIDWSNCTMAFKRAVSLDPRLHTRFIHSGRALTLFQRHDKYFPKEALIATLEYGFSLISQWNAEHPDEEPLRVSDTFLEWEKNPDLHYDVARLIEQYNIKFYTFDKKCFNKTNWPKWKLIYNSKEYPTKFATKKEWEEHFAPTEKPIEKVELPSDVQAELDKMLGEEK